MTDKELLELAAYSIGWRVRAYSEHGTSVVNGGTAVVVEGNRCFGWRPLTDDGDALRLATKLDLRVSRSECATADGNVWVQEQDGSDMYAETRRAIVRVAAEIGKGL